VHVPADDRLVRRSVIASLLIARARVLSERHAGILVPERTLARSKGRQ
jgi:hypothetical protein